MQIVYITRRKNKFESEDGDITDYKAVERNFTAKVNLANYGLDSRPIARRTYTQDYNPERDTELLINRRVG